MRLLLRAVLLVPTFMIATHLFGADPTAASGGFARSGASTSATSIAPTPRHFVVRVTPEMLRHSRIGNVIYFVWTIWSAAVLLFILRSGLSAQMGRLASRIGRPFVAAMVFFAMLSLVTALLELPLSFYAGYVVPHQFALTHQGLGGWLGDFGKALLVDLAIGSVVAALALFAIGRFKRWWLVLWIGTLPVTLIGVVLWPLFVDPLFNDFVPLRDPLLREQLLREASRAGIEGGRVYQVDKSKQTTTMNAYVTGIGPSKRIVMWDTLLAKMDRGEVLSVMGHEMGHYVLNHLWKGLAFALLISLVVTAALQPLTSRILRIYGPRWGIDSAADPAALPAILLIVSVLMFVLSPAVNGFARHVEHEADVFGLNLTGDNEAMASAFVKLSEDSKSDPDPNAFIEWWRYSHPAAGKRIRFALSYPRAAGSRGKPTAVRVDR